MTDSEQSSIKITPLDDRYAAFIQEALFKALSNPGKEPLKRTILQERTLVKYHESWGREGDFGFVAIQDPECHVTGICWCRLFQADNKGYGFVDNRTPELSIAVWDSYRGIGVGTQLLERTIGEARSRGYAGLSLSVQKQNRAVKLYERNGFVVSGSEGDDYVMYLELR